MCKPIMNLFPITGEVSHFLCLQLQRKCQCFFWLCTQSSTQNEKHLWASRQAKKTLGPNHGAIYVWSHCFSFLFTKLENQVRFLFSENSCKVIAASSYSIRYQAMSQYCKDIINHCMSLSVVNLMCWEAWSVKDGVSLYLLSQLEVNISSSALQDVGRN